MIEQTSVSSHSSMGSPSRMALSRTQCSHHCEKKAMPSVPLLGRYFSATTHLPELVVDANRCPRLKQRALVEGHLSIPFTLESFSAEASNSPFRFTPVSGETVGHGDPPSEPLLASSVLLGASVLSQGACAAGFFTRLVICATPPLICVRS